MKFCLQDDSLPPSNIEMSQQRVVCDLQREKDFSLLGEGKAGRGILPIWQKQHRLYRVGGRLLDFGSRMAISG